jgi:hypothetical protein
MAQLISIYNHPEYSTKLLTSEQFSELENLWHMEDSINENNGLEPYDVQALERYLS